MPELERERLARLEEVARSLREGQREMLDELGRCRKRLHNLEGISGTLVDMANLQKVDVANRQRRLELRIQVLTIVVGLAAVLSPIVLVLLSGR